MMRKLLAVGAGLAITSHAQEPAPQNPGACALNGAQAVSDMTDAAIFSWAASQRCTKGESYIVKCEIDVAQAVESVTRMCNVITQTVDSCGALKGANPQCGLATGKLLSHLSGLAAAGGQLIQQCPNGIAKAEGLVSDDALQQNGQSLADPAWPDGLPALCMVDVKDSIAHLFKAATAVSAAKEHCDEGGATCAYNAFGIVDALGGIARYLMGAVGHCSKPGAKLPENVPIHCAEAITNVAKQTSSFSAAAAEMSVGCAPKAAPSPPAPAPAAPLQEVETVEEVQPVFP